MAYCISFLRPDEAATEAKDAAASAKAAPAPATARARHEKRKALFPADDALAQSPGEALIPPPEVSRITLVAQFGSSVDTYCTEEADVRLHVRSGSLKRGQVAGPISIETSKRLLVECGGSSFLVSAVVDCQPSGFKFDKPLYLDFRVGEEWDGAGAAQALEEYKEAIRNTYTVSS